MHTGRWSLGLGLGVVAAWWLRRRLVCPTLSDVGRLPGDSLLPTADLVATRAIVIDAPVTEVWPWVAQLGQNRGGFYSYQAVENLLGCRMTNAAVVVPQWQFPQPGDEVRLAPTVALQVAQVSPGTGLVLLASTDDTGRHAGSAPGPMPYDFTWSFVLHPLGDRTRLVVRERYRYRSRWAGLLVEPVSAVSAVMTARMLSGIRQRAEARHRDHRRSAAQPEPRGRSAENPGRIRKVAEAVGVA